MRRSGWPRSERTGGVAVLSLRWVLLILGGAFVAALAVWERLRPRQARGQDVPRAQPEPESEIPTLSPLGPDPNATGEPYIGEQAIAIDTLAELPTMLLEEDESGAAHAAVPPTARAADFAPGQRSATARAGSTAISEPVAPALRAVRRSADPADELAEVAEGVGSVRIIEPEPAAVQVHGAPSAAGAEPVAAEAQAQSQVRAVFDAASIVLDWPPESERHIIALRVVAGAERFVGRTVRLALAAEGFRLGPLDIFHRPDETGRAVLSVASLTRPGTFRLDSMDAQRYAGLNLFAVLPGPLPAGETFELLLAAAENLNERLQGVVVDEHGEALTAQGLESLRASLQIDGGDGA